MRNLWFSTGRKIFFCLLGSLAAPAKGDDTIKIASYNVENLWDGEADNTEHYWQNFLDSLSHSIRQKLPQTLQYADYSSDVSNWYEQKILQQKVRNFIFVLKLAGQPAIVGLQELESSGNYSQVLDLPFDQQTSLRDKLHELGYRYFLLGPQNQNNPVAVTTAFISKIPLSPQPSVDISMPDFNTSARDIQVVEARFGSQRLLLFNGHLKSKGGGGNESERLRAVRALKERIHSERSRYPQMDVIILGDFNAHYYERPLKALGSTGNEREMLQANTSALYNLWFELPQQDRWENDFDGQRNQLSHILISADLYDYQGLQYVDQSFTVLGHRAEEAKYLLGADGRPYRWQIYVDRGEAIHIGQGFSDHLPLLATFKVMASSPNKESRSSRKMPLEYPSKETADDQKASLRFTKVQTCVEEESLDAQEISWEDTTSYLGRCVKIAVPPEESPLALHTHGKFASSYILLPYKDKNGHLKQKAIGLAMMRSFDWRPNIDDSRVSQREAAIEEGYFHAQNPHPRSNRCFQRQVLQGPGGQVRKAVGRIGYSEGYLNLHIASRQEHHLILEDLPRVKNEACPWEGLYELSSSALSYSKSL